MTELIATLRTLRVLGKGDPPRAREAVVLYLRDREGAAVGFGEASPLPDYSPETIEQARRELERICDRGVSLQPSLDADSAIEALFAVHGPESPSASFALETAALDWLGRRTRRPIHRLLGGDEAPASKSVAELVDHQACSQWSNRVADLARRGVTHVKFKIGTDFATELGALGRIRRSHPSLVLRLDANRRLQLGDLQRHLNTLSALGTEFIEEPVAATELSEALGLPLPIALDETVRDPSLFKSLLEVRRPVAVVLKPTVLGGLRPCRTAATVASAQGVPSVISHTLDGPIARAAAAELALTINDGLAVGLGEHPFLPGWPAHTIEAIQDRRVVPHARPGLGLRFAEALFD